MEKSVIDRAIKNHGAAAVYAAAADRLAGNRAKWQSVGLPDSKHLGDVNEVMTAAFALMTDAERALDLRTTDAALTKIAAKKTVTIRLAVATQEQIAALVKFGGTSDVIAVAVDRLWQSEGRKEMIVSRESVDGLWTCYRNYVDSDLAAYNGKIYKCKNVMVGSFHKIELDQLTSDEAAILKKIGAFKKYEL